MDGITTITYRFCVNGNYTKELKAKRGLRQGDLISPMLFVIIMDYLDRKLQDLDRIPNLNYHSKCGRLKITNLCFVDNLLMFARGAEGSVNLMMEKFWEFSKEI
ncbi:unnamed protein product [Lathyrus sativus]|nr:unnamed protein product [Lathyrus sativus]